MAVRCIARNGYLRACNRLLVPICDSKRHHPPVAYSAHLMPVKIELVQIVLLLGPFVSALLASGTRTNRPYRPPLYRAGCNHLVEVLLYS
jgi:hypothetical protein